MLKNYTDYCGAMGNSYTLQAAMDLCLDTMQLCGAVARNKKKKKTI